MQCVFNLSCPKCHKYPPLILKIENSLLLNKSIIKSKCPCSNFEILSQSLKEFYFTCTIDKKESDSNSSWELCLSKNKNFNSTQNYVDTLTNGKNNLTIVYDKVLKKIEVMEEVFVKIKQQIKKLYEWDKNLQNELIIFGQKLFDDFYMSKHTIYFSPMENFSNFNHNKDDLVTSLFIKMLPEIDNIYKLMNKLAYDNKKIIDSYVYKNIINQNYMNDNGGGEDLLLSIKNPVIMPKFGYLFEYAKNKCSINNNSNTINIKPLKIENNLNNNNINKTESSESHTINKYNYTKRFKFTHAHEDTVECACELSSGDIATCGNDLTIRFWRKYSQEPYASLFGHTGTILSVIQLKNGLLASSSSDKTIRIWDIKILQPVKILTEHTNSVIKLYQLKNSKFISCSSDSTLRIWDPLQNYSSVVLKGHKDTVESVVELDNGVIASCSLDEHIRIWDIYMKKCQKKIKVKRALLDIDYYEKGNLLVITRDQRLMMIQYDIGKILNEYVSKIPIYCLCHSFDGKIFLGCGQGYVNILNKGFQVITSLKIHKDVVVGLKLFNNQMLCTSSWDGTFTLSI